MTPVMKILTLTPLLSVIEVSNLVHLQPFLSFSLFLTETLLSSTPTGCTVASASAHHATRSKSNDTVTQSTADGKHFINDTKLSFTSSNSSQVHCIESPFNFNLSTYPGVKSHESPETTFQSANWQVNESLNGDKKSTHFSKLESVNKHVSLTNHIASSLFKPGGNRKVTEMVKECASNLSHSSSTQSSKDKQLSLNQAEIPTWYLHYLANVISSESSRGLDITSLDMTYEKVNQLKRLYQTYFETQEDLYTSPRTHFQPIRQDYYERPCNIVTDASIVGIIPCSRNCPNHDARRAGKKKKQNDCTQDATISATSGCIGEKGVVHINSNNSAVPASDLGEKKSVNRVEQSLYPCEVAPVTIEKPRPMSESREELASFIGPFSPIESTSMSDCEEYPIEDTKLSRVTVATSGDSIINPTETNNASYTSRSCGGDPCLNVTLTNQGKTASQREVITLPLSTARAHASMTDGNGDIEVPSKCSSNIDAKTEGKCDIIRQVLTDGESGTNSKNNHLPGDTTAVVDSNCYRNLNDMIIDAHTRNNHPTDMNSISSKNRCQLNSKYLQPQIMNQSTSKVIIEEVESDEVSSTANEIMFDSLTSKATSSRSTVTIEDAPIDNTSDSPVDDYDAIFSIVNDVLKSNQIVIEEGEYEDELKLLPSELKQDQRFVHSNLFSSSLKTPPAVSPNNFIPSNSTNSLDWSIDSPHNWSMFSSSRLPSSSTTSSPSVKNSSPPRSNNNNAVSSTTCSLANVQDVSHPMDTYEFTSRSDKYTLKGYRTEPALFIDASSNSSSSSSGYLSFNQKQRRNHFENQHSHVSSTVCSSESAVSSSQHDSFNSVSIDMACSPSTGYNGHFFKRDGPFAFEHRDDFYADDERVDDHHSPSISSHHQVSPNSHSSNRNAHVSTTSALSNPDSSSTSFNNTRLSNKLDSSVLRKKVDSQTLVNPSREKSSSPTVYQIEPRLEKVTAFSSKPCTFFLEGNCRKSDCKYSHDLSTITCKFWKEGFCFKGDLCPFAHDDLNCGVDSERPPSSPEAPFEEEKNVFTIDSEADFPSLADEKRPKLGGSSRNITSDTTLNAINLQVSCNKRNNSHKSHPSKGFTAVASVLNSSNNSAPFLSSSLNHSTSNVLFIDKSQSNGKGKKKKRTALKAI